MLLKSAGSTIRCPALTAFRRHYFFETLVTYVICAPLVPCLDAASLPEWMHSESQVGSLLTWTHLNLHYQRLGGLQEFLRLVLTLSSKSSSEQNFPTSAAVFFFFFFG